MSEKSKKKKVPASCVKFSENEYKQVKDSSKVSGKTIPALLKEAFSLFIMFFRNSNIFLIFTS